MNFFRRRESVLAVAAPWVVSWCLARRLTLGESRFACLHLGECASFARLGGFCGGKRRRSFSRFRRGSRVKRKARKTGILYNYHFFRLAGRVRLPLPACAAPPKKRDNYVPKGTPSLPPRSRLGVRSSPPRNPLRGVCGGFGTK